MSKFVCTVCGYLHEGTTPPENCPVCKAPSSKFKAQEDKLTWATVHEVGIVGGIDPEVIEGLKMNFMYRLT